MGKHHNPPKAKNILAHLDGSLASAQDTQACVASVQDDDVNDVLGLCCSNRKTCEKSQAPGGIWHCEKYD